jgi:hypothetical protein
MPALFYFSAILRNRVAFFPRTAFFPRLVPHCKKRKNPLKKP